MKFEKRTGGEQIPPSPQEDKPSAGRKPVVIYIMILFIVAFLLMALSFVMHQRSNTEVLGELQDSVSAMQEIQSTQDALLDLQDQLDDAEETVEALESAGEETQAALEAAELENRALLALYQLQQLYAAGDLDGCRETLAAIEAEDLAAALPEKAAEGVTTPADRYQQLRDAVEARTAADGAA